MNKKVKSIPGGYQVPIELVPKILEDAGKLADIVTKRYKQIKDILEKNKRSKMKVYCCNCKHYKSYCFEYSESDSCKHPSNNVLKDTYSHITRVEVSEPKKLNENNDCKNFEQKIPLYKII